MSSSDVRSLRCWSALNQVAYERPNLALASYSHVAVAGDCRVVGGAGGIDMMDWLSERCAALAVLPIYGSAAPRRPSSHY